MAFYKDCGWLPFGWNKTKADNVGKCSDLSTLEDGKCVLKGTPGQIVALQYDFCKANTGHPMCKSMQTRNLEPLKSLFGCSEDSFRTKECVRSIDNVLSATLDN